MSGSTDPFTETAEFVDDASYSWWRDTHPEGFVLAVRARHPPLLHRATCSDVDPDRKSGRLKAKGSRQVCADMKSALRAWADREIPDGGKLLARCPKCGP
ncbi:MAG: hypothetical protein KY464_14690 [Gemmatimonadetes bacterium]|nr:hypothetical protein [Gemmatimonadota bacterium]